MLDAFVDCCLGNDYVPIHAQNCTQHIARIRSGRCHVILRILLTILTAPDFASASLHKVSRLPKEHYEGCTYLVEIKTRSSTAQDVTETAKRRAKAAMSVSCLNWESPREVPKILIRSIVPRP